MKKIQLNDFFAYDYPDLFVFNKEKKVDSILENKNSNNNPKEKDTYNKRLSSRNYYGKKRRYYTDYI